MQREEMELLSVRATLWRMEIEILREIHRYRFAKLRRRARPCVATWVDWWRSVSLNAERIKPSCLARNSARLRSNGRYACFARVLRDYCEPAAGHAGDDARLIACRMVRERRRNT